MRIEKKREAEMEKRKGLTGRTIIAFLWLVVSFFASYLVASWLFSAEILDTAFFYYDLSIPDTVSETVLRLGVALLIFFAIQFFVLIGYAATSPKAKMRPGTPTTYSPEPDPYEETFTRD
jgi:hypothetical protein